MIARSSLSRSFSNGTTNPCWLALLAMLGAGQAYAQDDALRNSALAAQPDAQDRRLSQAPQDFTVKAGDFRLLVSTSLGLDWNDNINATKIDPKEDFILRPMLNLAASQPVTQNNLLRLNVGIGYDYYFDNTDYSGLRLTSGSELAFDIFIKSVRINLHERFSYTQDSAGQAAVANAGKNGGLNNTAGLSADWELKNAVVTLGYDHQNFVASSSEYDYQNLASEVVSLRGGYRFYPTLTAGVEGRVSFNNYEKEILNNSVGYSAGLYADWQPGTYFHVQPNVGYTIYDFRQTSRYILATDQDAWYLGLTVGHDITETVSYSLSAGHELRLGTQADAVEDWYVRPAVNWKIIKNVSLNTSISYENGTQGSAGLGRAASENYDWVALGFGASYSPVKRLSVGLNYRLTLRYSDQESRGYTQNVVGLQLTYAFK